MKFVFPKNLYLVSKFSISGEILGWIIVFHATKYKILYIFLLLNNMPERSHNSVFDEEVSIMLK